MTWKLFALTLSGGMLAVTYLLSHPLAERVPATPSTQPQEVNQSDAGVDLAAEADRLRTRLAETSAYRVPARNAFQFRAAASPAAAPKTLQPDAPPAPQPVRPPFGLSGLAISTENGMPQRTAILSSLRGVVLAREGDVVDGGYRVIAITDEVVTLSTDDGQETTIRLSGSDVP